MTSHTPEPWCASRAPPSPGHHTVMPEAPGSSIHPSTHNVNKLQPIHVTASNRVSHHIPSRFTTPVSFCKRRTQIHLQPIDRIHRPVPRMHLALLLLLLLLLLSSKFPVLVLFRGHQEHHRRGSRSRTPETRKGRQRHPLGDASSQLLVLLFQPIPALPISAPGP